ncbi:hypothetical protein EJB05_40040, partial [Eragrostis curvula]
MAPLFHMDTLLPSSISPKISYILQSHDYPRVGRVFRALAKFRSLLLHALGKTRRGVLPWASSRGSKHAISYHARSSSTKRSKIADFMMSKPHYSSSAARAKELDASHAWSCYESAWNVVVPAPAAGVDGAGEYCGYLCWLEEETPDDEVLVVEEGEDGDGAGVNEIDRLAEKFIERCHAKFLLEKQESYRSTIGCPFGEGCHFSHFIPGGYPAVAKMLNLGSPAVSAPSRAPVNHAPVANSHPASTGKTRMCTKYNTAEGCKFGEKCHFAHGERELGKPAYMSHHEGPPMGGRFGGRPEPRQPSAMGPPAGSFGASATAKISVDASLAGGIIGKGGVNTKQISRVTGVKLSIRDHESDPNLKNIELEGNFDQIKQASNMVGELIATISANMPVKNPSGPTVPAGRGGGGGSGGRTNYKTKLCENFVKGTCTFGERCHFAHGESEQRRGPA